MTTGGLGEAGKLREARSRLAAIEGTVDAAETLADLARAEGVRGQWASAARSLCAEWLILHQYPLIGRQCTTLARISGELVAQGDLTGARSVAEECAFEQSQAKSHPLRPFDGGLCRPGGRLTHQRAVARSR